MAARGPRPPSRTHDFTRHTKVPLTDRKGPPLPLCLSCVAYLCFGVSPTPTQGPQRPDASLARPLCAPIPCGGRVCLFAVCPWHDPQGSRGRLGMARQRHHPSPTATATAPTPQTHDGRRRPFFLLSSFFSLAAAAAAAARGERSESVRGVFAAAARYHGAVSWARHGARAFCWGGAVKEGRRNEWKKEWTKASLLYCLFSGTSAFVWFVWVLCSQPIPLAKHPSIYLPIYTRSTPPPSTTS